MTGFLDVVCRMLETNANSETESNTSFKFDSIFITQHRSPTAAKWALRKHCCARTLPGLWFGWSWRSHQKHFQILLECLFISLSVCYDPQTISCLVYIPLSITPVTLHWFCRELDLVWIWLFLSLFIMLTSSSILRSLLAQTFKYILLKCSSFFSTVSLDVLCELKYFAPFVVCCQIALTTWNWNLKNITKFFILLPLDNISSFSDPVYELSSAGIYTDLNVI